jgi:hypothetical protein
MKTQEEEEEDPIEVIIILRARFKTEHPLTNVNTSATTHHRATFKICYFQNPPPRRFQNSTGLHIILPRRFQTNATILPPGVHATMLTRQPSVLISKSK